MGHVYLQNGNIFAAADPKALNIREVLPPGTYTIGVTPRGYHLEQIENFDLPGKLYGDVDSRASRVLTTFLDRPATTGVLLSGQKGAGKTMLTKRICQRALDEHGIITIVINRPLSGEDFNSFLQAITQPAIVLFDEFEKVYDRDDQQKLLTIFDGVYASKKLFLLTCNDRYRIDSYMHNRPGRIYYSMEFAGLDEQFVTEYCQDNLKNMENLRGVLACSTFFSEFSFDMLKALVEEMNRYGETATQAMQVLNMKPQNDSDGIYEITVMRDGKKVPYRSINDSEIKVSPLAARNWTVYIYGYDDDDESRPADGIIEDESYPLDPSKLIHAKDGVFVFGTHRPDTTLHFKRKVRTVRTFDYDAL